MAGFNFNFKEIVGVVVELAEEFAVANDVAAECSAAMLRLRKKGTVEKLLNYSFKNPALLEEALTHASSDPSNGPTYERLEFIGDAALALAVSKYFYRTNCQIGPGRLTSLRSGNVSTEKLARVAVHHNLYPLLRRNSPDLDDMVIEFTRAVEAEEAEDTVDAEEGGVGFVYDSPVHGGIIVGAPKVLADVVEAIIGAVYVDCNFNLEEMWFHVRGILEPIITDEVHLEQPVSKLYEICQKNGKVIDVEDHVNEMNYYVVSIIVDGRLLSTSTAKRKSIAKLYAARAALSKLSAEAPDVVAKCNDVSSHIYYTNAIMKENEGKMLLNEFCSRRRWPKPVYRVETEGPPQARRYKCSVRVQNSSVSFVASGDFKSKVKEAENNAAYKMFLTLESTV